MARNEAQTRYELIDPALERRQWRRSDIRVEETAPKVDIIYGVGQRRPAGRTDYVLRRPLVEAGEPIPLAIIEAKREGLPATHGLQQGKGYRGGALHHVPFVYSSNGHLFVEYDEETGATSDERPMAEFPTPADLVARYLAQRGLPSDPPSLALLSQPYQQGRDHLRYYQDAAVRAACEQIIVQRRDGRPRRILLNLATGAGKTRIAAALLRKLFDAGLVHKALFLCDRTELRENGLLCIAAVMHPLDLTGCQKRVESCQRCGSNRASRKILATGDDWKRKPAHSISVSQTLSSRNHADRSITST